MEDEMHCVRSANEIRHFLTGVLGEAKAGNSLAMSIRAMRTALRAFVDAAGPNGDNFRYRRSTAMTDEFSLALGELRSRIGLHIALIADHYNIEVEEKLAEILPPDIEDDLLFPPRFGEPD